MICLHPPLYVYILLYISTSSYMISPFSDRWCHDISMPLIYGSIPIMYIHLCMWWYDIYTSPYVVVFCMIIHIHLHRWYHDVHTSLYVMVRYLYVFIGGGLLYDDIYTFPYVVVCYMIMHIHLRMLWCVIWWYLYTYDDVDTPA